MLLNLVTWLDFREGVLRCAMDPQKSHQDVLQRLLSYMNVSGSL